MLTVDSKVKDLAANPQAVEICKKYGMDLTDKRIKMAFGISARKLAGFPATGFTPEKLEEMNKELTEANLG